MSGQADETEQPGTRCSDPAEEGHSRQVLEDVWRFLDDEVDAQRRAAVQQHLDDCSPCLEEAGMMQKLKALLAAKCGGDRAPESLRLRVTQLCAESVTTVVTGQDGAVRAVVSSRRTVAVTQTLGGAAGAQLPGTTSGPVPPGDEA